jgi:hypothetical protein
MKINITPGHARYMLELLEETANWSDDAQEQIMIDHIASAIERGLKANDKKRKERG